MALCLILYSYAELMAPVLQNIPLHVKLLDRIFMRSRSGTFRYGHEKFHWPGNFTGHEYKYGV